MASNIAFSKVGILGVFVYCMLLVATVPEIVPLFALMLPWSVFTGVPSQTFFLLFFVILNGLIVYLFSSLLDTDYSAPSGPIV